MLLLPAAYRGRAAGAALPGFREATSTSAASRGQVQQKPSRHWPCLSLSDKLTNLVILLLPFDLFNVRKMGVVS
ncbi:unnamed protein product [Urochloa humidicola]